MADVRITVVDPGQAAVSELLGRHLDFARATTPPQDVHALDSEGLQGSSVTLFGLHCDGQLLALGALRRIDDEHAEIKSMHTARAARRRGLGGEMLAHLIATARTEGFRRVSLETGSGPAFAPARSLYSRAGFVPCGAFGSYRESPNSAYMTLLLRN